MSSKIQVLVTGTETFGHSKTWFEKTCLLTFTKAGFLKKYPRRKFMIHIDVVTDAKIKKLNKEHRGKDKATNVLSFPAFDAQDIYPKDIFIPLGDIVLSNKTILREAKEQGKKPKEHFAHLVIHGLLHLVGYDHENEQEADKMESLEIALLKQMGIKNPYIL